MIVDPEFTKEIRIQNQKFEQFLIRSQTIGPDVVDYIRLAKPPMHPFKKKNERLTKQQL